MSAAWQRAIVHDSATSERGAVQVLVGNSWIGWNIFGRTACVQACCIIQVYNLRGCFRLVTAGSWRWWDRNYRWSWAKLPLSCWANKATPNIADKSDIAPAGGQSPPSTACSASAESRTWQSWHANMAALCCNALYIALLFPLHPDQCPVAQLHSVPGSGPSLNNRRFRSLGVLAS